MPDLDRRDFAALDRVVRVPYGDPKDRCAPADGDCWLDGRIREEPRWRLHVGLLLIRERMILMWHGIRMLLMHWCVKYALHTYQNDATLAT